MSDFIVMRDGIAMLRDTNVSVDEVVLLSRSGVNMVDIQAQFPALSVADVFAALRHAGRQEEA